MRPGKEPLLRNGNTTSVLVGTAPLFAVVIALAMSLVLVFLTRLPVARPWAMETDEFGFLDQIRVHWFPMHHTLFLAAGRLLGMLKDETYRNVAVWKMEGFTNKEIAVKLGCAQRTVERRLILVRSRWSDPATR